MLPPLTVVSSELLRSMPVRDDGLGPSPTYRAIVSVRPIPVTQPIRMSAVWMLSGPQMVSSNSSSIERIVVVGTGIWAANFSGTCALVTKRC